MVLLIMLAKQLYLAYVLESKASRTLAKPFELLGF